MSQAQQQPQNQPQPGTPEYAQMMAERFSNQGNQPDPNRQSFQQQPQKPQRPAHIPEKFWDAEKGEVRVEALAKSYAELERARSQQPQPQAKPDGQPSQEQAQDAVAKAGLQWDALGQKLATQGQLDEADYDALEKAGIPRAITDNYIAALKTAHQAARAKTAEYVGGEEVLNTILTRASQELEPAEIDAYNAMLANPKTAQATIDVLKARFAPADGEPSGQINGMGGGPGSMVGFGSLFEQTEAINKRNERGQRLYDVDPAYREQVRRRIALTKAR